MSQQFDAYRILQVLPTADQDEIKVAYRRLARRYHPDRASDDLSIARMIELNQAWELIGDAVKRAAYDRANGIASTRRQHDTGSSGSEAAPGGGRSSAASEGPRGVHGSVGRSDPGEAGAAPHAGPPPGRPSGSVLTFGRYSGWSLGEISRVDREYLEWLDRMPIGRQYRGEIRALMDARARAAEPAEPERPRRRGIFR